MFGAAVAATALIGPDRVRSVFQNVSPTLMEFLTFGFATGVGVIIVVAVSAVAGLLGALLRVAPPDVRRPVTAAIAVTLAFGFLQRVIPIALDQLRLERDWLYSVALDGLTWLGAAVVAAVSAGVSVLRSRFGSRVRERLVGSGAGAPGFAPGRLLLLALAFGALVVAPRLFGSVISDSLGFVMVFALLGIGLNIVVGYAGLLDLGYVFFFAVGAYSMALLTGATLNVYGLPPEPALVGSLNFYVAIPIVMLIAAGAGLLIGAPVLRLRGDYLALVTLGLGEMVTVLIASPWFVPLVGGPSGMRGITDAAIGGYAFRDPQQFYYLALAFVLVAMFVSWRLAASRVGRAWTALREDEQTADAMGISTTRFKLLAFAIGGAIGSLGGALFAVKIGSLTPASFQVIISIQVLGIVVLGGLGSLPGVIVGALVLVGLPGLLREFEEFRLLAYGGALVAIMVLRPQGLVPNVRRSRELREEEATQDAWVKAGEPIVEEEPV
jgi:branched-chain amino acid transport system permease protein